MPVNLEHKLFAQARDKYPDDKEKQRAYVYGTLRKTGWRPGKEQTNER